jgi:hypothetical protein
LTRLQEDGRRNDARLDEVLQSHERIYSAIVQSNQSNSLEHSSTKLEITRQIENQIVADTDRHDSVVERMDEARNRVLDVLSITAEQNRAEHNITRAEIQRIADLKFGEIRSEVCRSKVYVDRNDKAPVTRIGSVLPMELKSLQEWSFFKFGLWFGAELALTYIKVSLLPCIRTYPILSAAFRDFFMVSAMNHPPRKNGPSLILDPILTSNYACIVLLLQATYQ